MSEFQTLPYGQDQAHEFELKSMMASVEWVPEMNRVRRPVVPDFNMWCAAANSPVGLYLWLDYPCGCFAVESTSTP